MGEVQAKQTTELSNDLNVITAEINAYKQVAGEAIFEIGRRLKHVKENDLVHGEWTKWCEEELGMKRQQADMFIKVAEDLGGEFDKTFCHLGLSALYHIATLPPDQRKQPHTIPSTGETKTVDEMTVRELREVKKALKEAERRAEQAERYAEEKENEVERLKSRPKPEPRVEVRTEYVEVEDEKTRERLRKYEERFGDIEDYDERVTASNRQDLTVSVISFNKAVRDLAKRYSYMTQYKNLVAELDEVTRKEYNQAVKVLQELAHDFDFADEKTGAIDAEYVEIN